MASRNIRILGNHITFQALSPKKGVTVLCRRPVTVADKLDYPRKYPTLINSVTREDILRVAKKYLHPDTMVIVVVANQEKAKLKY